MLALIALNARPGQPEPHDRDPGIISLMAAIYRSVRKDAAGRMPRAGAEGRTAHSTAWPVRGLWHIR